MIYKVLSLGECMLYNNAVIQEHKENESDNKDVNINFKEANTTCEPARSSSKSSSSKTGKQKFYSYHLFQFLEFVLNIDFCH